MAAADPGGKAEIGVQGVPRARGLWAWLLVTTAMHMPRAVGCFRAAGFQVEAYPIEFTTRGRAGPFTGFASASSALIQLDRAAKEWIGLIAYRLMGKTDALFPAP